MTRNRQSFVEWVKQKFSIGSKKRYAGATEEQNYFRYETFNFQQLKEKLADVDDVSVNPDDKSGIVCQEPSLQSVKKNSDTKPVDPIEPDELKMKMTACTNCESHKLRNEKRNSKRKGNKNNRMTVIPTLESSPNEKTKAPLDESTLKKSGSRFRFSFVGSLRRKLRRDSTYNNDNGSSEYLESKDLKNDRVDSSYVQYCRSKRILSDPSLKIFSSKCSVDERHNDSGFEEISNRGSDKFCEDAISPLTSDHNETSKANGTQRGVKKSINVPQLRQLRKMSEEETQQMNKTIELVKVSSFFSNPPFPEVKPLKFSTLTGHVNEYVGLSVQSEFSETLPRSPAKRNSDPYVNLKFHGLGNYSGSQQSIHEDNYCLRFDEWAPAVPPRTYKTGYSKQGLVRGSKSYQSFSNISNVNINKTIQQLPKSVATKCETFCRRVDALPFDYIPMDMHPLSSKLSIHRS